MHTGVTQNTNDEAVSLAGVAASSFSGPAAREAKIIPFKFQAPTAAALVGLEEAIEIEDTFEVLGSIAVRLVGQWSLPRLVVMEAPGREEP